MKHINNALVEEIIANVAAAEIMPRYRMLAEGDVEMKGVDDPVTVADQAAEHALTEHLQKAFPGSVIVGEESYAKDPSITSRFSDDQDVWVIDPIDGTRNFVAGLPEFAVMVGLVRKGQIIAGWIYDPHTKDMLTAEQGGGVWLRGHKLRLAGLDKDIPKLAIIGSRFERIIANKNLSDVFNILPQFVGGSATSFDYGRLFTGDVLFAKSTAPRAAYLLYRQSKPWDHVPGLLMVHEAGGYAASADGEPYDMQKGEKGLMITPDRQSWQTFSNDFNQALKYLKAV
jgi:fructose-1,6-bisphosphatase/inositol monophosphatase family enzyme